MKIDKEQENLQFKPKNIIRITEEELDMPIYRVFTKRWLIDALTKGVNGLVKPRMWDDPFENFIFRSTATTNQGHLVGFDNMRENYYGQCWTFSAEETDALWRIYSPCKDGFRVKTTIRKIFDTFYDAKHRWATIAFYVGRISYENESDIRTHFEDPEILRKYLFDTSGNGQVETLLVKRIEFKHENELRFIFSAHPEWHDVTADSYNFPIDINFHFEEILADPRMGDNDFVNNVAEIRALGYKNSIEKSRLYQIPNLRLTLNI